ncbi:MAG: bifunctional DNA-formamidopyrimidine glycosylase/DNA-(apurinic or apyrimidinic site) lyase [bacterium]|nr:bifunctional DNA-formamidopyrimidine glycosylase/DNA-(apurinic or apyrimidinic site) lyase [bacterium]
MPELPEVETVVRQIRPRLIHRTISGARFSVPRQLAPQTPREISVAVRGKYVETIVRRGKFIGIELTGGTLLIHLRMTGRLYVRTARKIPLPYERAWFDLDNGTDTLVFRDPRTLGTIRFFPAGREIGPLVRLGWEPLHDDVSVDDVRAALARRTIAIKPLLLDQSVWAGIGNIYASEVLWAARIDPRTSCSRLSRAQVERLRDAVPVVLRRALERGGSTLRDFASPDGQPGSYQREFRVYDREGEPCLHCGKPIRRIVQAKRSTYFCSACQKRR